MLKSLSRTHRCLQILVPVGMVHEHGPGSRGEFETLRRGTVFMEMDLTIGGSRLCDFEKAIGQLLFFGGNVENHLVGRHRLVDHHESLGTLGLLLRRKH